jgi:hypothetical protein
MTTQLLSNLATLACNPCTVLVRAQNHSAPTHSGVIKQHGHVWSGETGSREPPEPSLRPAMGFAAA